MAWYDGFFKNMGRENDKKALTGEMLLTILLGVGIGAALFFFAAPAIIAPIAAAASIPVVGGAIAAAAPVVAYATVAVGALGGTMLAGAGVKLASDRLGISEKGAIDKASRGALSKAKKEAKAEVRFAEKQAKEEAKQKEKEKKQKEKTKKADKKAEDKQNKIDGIKLDSLKEQIDKNKDTSKDAKTIDGRNKHDNANQYYSDKMAGLIKGTVDQMGKKADGDLSKLPAEQLAKLSEMIQDTEKRAKGADGKEQLSDSAKGKLDDVKEKINKVLQNGSQEKINDFKTAGGKSDAVKSNQEQTEAKVNAKIQETMEKFSDPQTRADFISTNSDKIDYLDIIKEVYGKIQPNKDFNELSEDDRTQFVTQNNEQIQELATLKCTELSLKEEIAEQKATQEAAQQEAKQAEAKLAKEQEELQQTQKAATEKATRQAEVVTSLISELGMDLKNLKVSDAKGQQATATSQSNPEHSPEPGQGRGGGEG